MRERALPPTLLLRERALVPTLAVRERALPPGVPAHALVRLDVVRGALPARALAHQLAARGDRPAVGARFCVFFFCCFFVPI